MKVLVSAASKHGATAEVAAAIGRTLRAAGLEVELIDPADVTSLAGFDAAVIGSAIYVGRWMEPARALIERESATLRQIPVWLFSSGPVGEPPKPVEEPVDAAPLRTASGAREHRTFAGLVERKRLGFGEKAVMTAVRAREGDYRPWTAIEDWAREIAATLEAPARAR